MSTEASSMPVASKPWRLWAIGIVALLWNAVGALDYVMTQTKNESYLASLTQEQLDYIYGFPAWAVAAWAIAVWGGVLGSVLLLLRKRQAVPVFLVSFIAMVLTTIYNFLLSDGLKHFGGAGQVVFSAMIFVVALALLLYAKRLESRRVLV